MPYKLLAPGKRGAAWYIRGTDRSGRFEYSTGEVTRRGAEAWAEDFLAQRARRRVPGAGEPVAFDIAADHYKAAKPHLGKEDLRLVDAVARHFRGTDCRAIVPAHLVAAALELRPKGSPSTRNRKVIKPAAAVLHFAAEQRWCEHQRFPAFEEPRRTSREPAAEATLQALMEHLEKPRQAKRGRKADRTLPWKKLLLAMLYETGLRITDLLRIEWRGIDLPAAEVRVRISKTDEFAALRLSPIVVTLLANLPRKEGRLFPWSNRSGVYHWLSWSCDQASVTYTPHQSRHALATAALEAGIPDKKAAELGVWRDARSLHRYQHVRPDAIPGRHAGVLLRDSAKKAS